jgi:hypothetical protein
VIEEEEVVEFCEESVEETVKVREYTLPTDKEKGGRRKLRGSFEIDFRDELGFGFEIEIGCNKVMLQSNFKFEIWFPPQSNIDP